MCLKVNANNERMTRLDHVKTLTVYMSNINNRSIGIYKDGIFYRMEDKIDRDYICFTVKIGGTWQWQQ